MSDKLDKMKLIDKMEDLKMDKIEINILKGCCSITKYLNSVDNKYFAAIQTGELHQYIHADEISLSNKNRKSKGWLYFYYNDAYIVSFWIDNLKDINKIKKLIGE